MGHVIMENLDNVEAPLRGAQEQTTNILLTLWDLEIGTVCKVPTFLVLF